MAHVRLNRVSRAFVVGSGRDAQTVKALDDVSFNVEQGEVVAIAGPSGCGKTTALRIIMGLETATSGTISVGGKQVAGCGLDRGMVFQHAELLPWKTAAGNIKFALSAKGIPDGALEETTLRYLDLVGLKHAKDRRPHQLSGGMRQRIGIARALAIDPEVLLMDEPFGALDSQTREQLQLEVLDIHQRTGKTIIFVTHDLDEAVLLADRIVVMARGRVQQIIPVAIPRPRSDVRAIIASVEFMTKRALVWSALHDPALPAALETAGV